MPTTKNRAVPVKKVRSYKGRKKEIDPVQVQVSILVPKLRYRGKPVNIKSSVIQEAIQQWAETGEAPEGFQIKGVEWENYGRHKERRYADDEESIEEARLTLKLGLLFRGRYVKFQPIRRDKGTAPAKPIAVGFRPSKGTGNKTTVRRTKNRRAKP